MLSTLTSPPPPLRTGTILWRSVISRSLKRLVFKAKRDTGTKTLAQVTGLTLMSATVTTGTRCATALVSVLFSCRTPLFLTSQRRSSFCSSLCCGSCSSVGIVICMCCKMLVVGDSLFGCDGWKPPMATITSRW